MNLNTMIQFVLDKANMRSGDRQTENIIKNAINTAYMDFARLDCDVVEAEFKAPLQTVNALPMDFLVDLNLYHDALGAIDKSHYKTTGRTLIIGKDVATYDTTSKVTLMYGRKPDLLEEEDDEPVIREEYHLGLCYYALHEITQEQTYLAQYQQLLESVPPFEPFLEDSIQEELTRNITEFKG